MERPDLRHLPYSTGDEYEELMATEHRVEPRECECECSCINLVFTDDDPPICLSCLHGYHIEDE